MLAAFWKVDRKWKIAKISTEIPSREIKNQNKDSWECITKTDKSLLLICANELKVEIEFDSGMKGHWVGSGGVIEKEKRKRGVGVKTEGEKVWDEAERI